MYQLSLLKFFNRYLKVFAKYYCVSAFYWVFALKVVCLRFVEDVVDLVDMMSMGDDKATIY